MPTTCTLDGISHYRRIGQGRQVMSSATRSSGPLLSICRADEGGGLSVA